MNIDKLEEIARAVTEPIAWSVVQHGSGADIRAKYAAGGSVWIAECSKAENAAHIAAFDPPTALALLAVCKAAAKVLASSWITHDGRLNRLEGEEEMRAALKSLEAQ